MKRDRLAIDQRAFDSQTADRLSDLRQPVGKIRAAGRVQRITRLPSLRAMIRYAAGREARNPYLREIAERMQEALYTRTMKAKPGA
jgi:hypothetical protein